MELKNKINLVLVLPAYVLIALFIVLIFSNMNIGFFSNDFFIFLLGIIFPIMLVLSSLFIDALMSETKALNFMIMYLILFFSENRILGLFYVHGSGTSFIPMFLFNAAKLLLFTAIIIFVIRDYIRTRYDSPLKVVVLVIVFEFALLILPSQIFSGLLMFGGSSLGIIEFFNIYATSNFYFYTVYLLPFISSSSLIFERKYLLFCLTAPYLFSVAYISRIIFLGY